MRLAKPYIGVGEEGEKEKLREKKKRPEHAIA
jgi:hypothetical protein